MAVNGFDDTVTVNTPAPVPGSLTVAAGAGYLPNAPYDATALPGQTVLTVGPDGEFQTIGAAVAAAQNGDLILVAPGTYVNDFADITAQITIAGAGGMVNLVATEALPNEKGIFIVDNNCQIDNLTFQGAEISDDLGGNGAGIRYQGGNLVLNNDAFLDNQNGIMGSAVDNLPQNSFAITDCTFDNNGQSSGPDAGFTHNIYVGTGVTSLVAEHNIFERANVGHELKSRAETNLLADNIFYDGPTGTASYDIDLPDGGADTVTGNVIEKGPLAQNDSMIHFGGEGIPYAGSALTITGNEFINDLGSQAVGVLNQTTLQVNITGNEFDNFANATIAYGSYAQSGNWDQNGDTIAPSSSSNFAPGTDLYDFSADSLAHNVTLTTSAGVLGGGGLLTVAVQAGHVTVVGGSGGLDYQEAPGWGGSAILTVAGASDTIAALGQDTIQAGGNDLISGGTGNLTAELDGNDSVTSGTGDNVYTVNGTLFLAGGGGSDSVQINDPSAAAFVHGNEGFLALTVNGGLASLNMTQGGATDQVTMTGGGAEAQFYGGASYVTTAGGTGGANISFAAGQLVYVQSEGADTIRAGSATTTLQVSGSASIYDGTGSLSVFGHGITGEATVNGGVGAVSIEGDTGNILFVGGVHGETLNAVLSNITIDGGAGQLSVTGGSRQVVQGGAGGIVFATTGGADTISTSTGAHDTITLTAASTLISNGIDHIYAGNGNSAITVNGAATIAGSTAAATYQLNGTDVLLGHGYTRATVGAAAHDTVMGAGTLTSVSVAGGTLLFEQLGNTDGETALVKGPGASLTAAAAANMDAITLAGAGDGTVLYGGHQSVTMQAAGAHVWATAGTDTINVNAGGGMIWGGNGSVTLVFRDTSDHLITSVQGGAGTLVQQAGAGNMLFTAGRGNAVLGGVSGAETVNAGAGNMTLTGGGGWTRFVAGAGDAQVSLTGAGGVVVFGSGTATITEAATGHGVLYDFVAGHGGGNDTIMGYHNGTDQLQFQGVTVSADSVVGGSTLLTLSDGTHVTFVGVDSVTLHG